MFDFMILNPKNKLAIAAQTTQMLQDAVAENGMSTAKLSRECGISETNLRKILKGATGMTPTLWTLAKIAKAIGCELEIKFVPKKTE